MFEQPVPSGKSSVTVYVAVKGAARFLDFVQHTFGTEPAMTVENPDGTIGHAEIRVGSSVLMAFDAKPEWPDMPSLLSVYVDDVDAVLGRALQAGATIVTELATSRIIGDRGCRIRDPLGNIWWPQTHLEDVAPEQVVERFTDPAALAQMRHAQQSFEDEMHRRLGKPTPRA